jgi:hypothetical protein
MAYFIISGLFIISLTIGLFIISSMLFMSGIPPAPKGFGGATVAAGYASPLLFCSSCYLGGWTRFPAPAYLIKSGFYSAILNDILIISGVIIPSIISSCASSIGGAPGLWAKAY